MPTTIPVPFQSQMDNLCGEGWHECFTTSAAMAAMHWGKVTSDDHYDRIRMQYGDTESPIAHVRALSSLGLKAAFRSDLRRDDLTREIAAGRPVPVGWLQHGHFTSPCGGGHWCTVIGTTDSGVIVHDPYGDPDLVRGGWLRVGGGRSLHYSWRHWGPRWQPEGDGHGWGLLISRA
jgi:hypothetical protein